MSYFAPDWVPLLLSGDGADRDDRHSLQGSGAGGFTIMTPSPAIPPSLQSTEWVKAKDVLIGPYVNFSVYSPATKIFVIQSRNLVFF